MLELVELFSQVRCLLISCCAQSRTQALSTHIPLRLEPGDQTIFNYNTPLPRITWHSAGRFGSRAIYLLQ